MVQGSKPVLIIMMSLHTFKAVMSRLLQNPSHGEDISNELTWNYLKLIYVTVHPLPAFPLHRATDLMQERVTKK